MKVIAYRLKLFIKFVSKKKNERFVSSRQERKEDIKNK